MIRRITLAIAASAVGIVLVIVGAPAASAAPVAAPPPPMFCTGSVCFLVCATIDAVIPIPQRWCYPF
ncbi:hypothetical protein [Gordonia neofelifaecis]|uniref:Secreted peptide n=1 Tax=Gordonia neofelifaecis NRRL B-59395 TaxID=644548 RepID=F1YKL7_9ACTN|nr:hypothetical protein [Gordonia neofelifaecis]EGD54661.1 hypothetical protein SCNU_12252 [Gordonia neofelifaecis NRRL B-59395]